MGLVDVPVLVSVAPAPGAGDARADDEEERVVCAGQCMYFGQGKLEGAWMSFAEIHLLGSVCRFWVDDADTGLAHLIGKDEGCVLERIGG